MPSLYIRLCMSESYVGGIEDIVFWLNFRNSYLDYKIVQNSDL